MRKDTATAVQGYREIAFCIETSLSNIEGDERSSNGDGNEEDVNTTALTITPFQNKEEDQYVVEGNYNLSWM